MNETIGRIAGWGEDLMVKIPRKDRHKFKKGDYVVVAKVSFTTASKLVKR